MHLSCIQVGNFLLLMGFYFVKGLAAFPLVQASLLHLWHVWLGSSIKEQREKATCQKTAIQITVNIFVTQIELSSELPFGTACSTFGMV